MSKKHYLKRGDHVSIIADDEYNGEITLLTPYCISVQSMSPIGCVINKKIPEKYRDAVCFASRIDDVYCATECGVNTALDLLMRIGTEEGLLLEDPFRLKDMVEEYRNKELELTLSKDTIRSKGNRDLFYELDGFLVDLKDKYFPDIKEIDFDAALIDKLQEYVEKNT